MRSSNIKVKIHLPIKKFTFNHSRVYDNKCFTYNALIFISLMTLCTWLAILLLQSGDIHENPGPVSTSSTESDVLSSFRYHLSLVHLNVQSVRNKLDLLFTELKEFDILAFSETWLNDSVSSEDLLLLSFHKPERKDRTFDSHGGVMLYVKSNLHYKRRYDLELNRVENIWIELRLENNKRVLIGLFYRAPNSNTLYNNDIEDSISLAVDTDINDIIVTGDFNYDAFNTNTNRKILSICQQFNMEQIIEESTHFTESSQSLIDLIFVSNKNTIIKSGVGEHILDQEQRYHVPVFCLFKFRKPKQPCFQRTIWEYNRGDYVKLRNDFNSFQWEECFDFNISKYADNVSNQILIISKYNIPNKDIYVRPLDAPWITNTIRSNIRRRKRLYRKAKLTQSNMHWVKFKQLRNQIVSQIKEAKAIYYSKLSDKLKQESLSSKDWWKILKSFISPTQTTSIPPLQNQNTQEIVFSEDQKANLLNEYFLNQTYIDNSDSNVPDLGPQTTSTVINDLLLTASETEDILKSLKVDKASGPDGISNKILREAAKELSIPLTNLFNQSLSCCKVPASWKEAHVTAIFKKGDASLPSNYRPISLLNTMEKVFERLIFKHLFNHLNANRILTPVQSGFIPGDSTVNQLVYIYDILCKALDDGLEARVIFFDISKAFDKVWHKGILCKLKYYGVSGNIFKWFQDYLSCRRQCVVLRNAKSSWGVLSAGVPQGSILGPLLFLIYINDIVQDLQSNVNLFADDTSLYLVIENPQTAAQQLQSDIEIIAAWAEKWLVTFNPSKSESLIVSRKRNSYHQPLQMLNQTIPEVKDHKHLGLFLSHNCLWHSHIEYINEKAWKRVNIMRKLKFMLDRKSLEIIYISFIRPILEYADVVWGNAFQYELDLLDKIQNECARIVSGATRLVSIENLNNEVNWETLEQRRYKHRLTLFYKIKHGIAPEYLSEPIPYQTNTRYNLRNSNDTIGISARTSLYFSSFFPSSIREWNNLPLNIRNLPTLSMFKNYLSRDKKTTPKYFYFGDRKLQILHTRLRTKCSSLNYHLFLKNISPSPLCECGQMETNFHYFFECNRFRTCREKLLGNLNNFDITLNTLLFGNPDISDTDNANIFKHVHTFISESKRFL